MTQVFMNSHIRYDGRALHKMCKWLGIPPSHLPVMSISWIAANCDDMIFDGKKTVVS